MEKERKRGQTGRREEPTSAHMGQQQGWCTVAVKTAAKPELKAIGYELFIGALSVLSILNLLLVYIFAADADVQNVILVMNAVMTPIFLGDFIFRLMTAESKSAYFWRGFGWADLLSSLPLAQAKILRLFRLWRVIRLLVRFGARNLARQFVRHRAENALLTVVFLVLCVLEFGALAILNVEKGAEGANILDASDALWWVYVSITTVGYGDRFPVSNTGRIIGLFVLTAGVGLFGTLSGFLANAFLTQPPEESEEETAAADATARTEATGADDPAVAETASGTGASLHEIQRLLALQEATASDLRQKVAELERRLNPAS
jgi:voltage-gated potassium channel